MRRYIHVYSTEGMLQADVIKSLLEAEGITVTISQESVGQTFGLTVGPVGEARIYVPEEQEERARQILAAMDAGELDSDNTGN